MTAKFQSPTKSVKPDLAPLKTSIDELVKYFTGDDVKSRSPSGLLNWLRVKPGGGWFSKKHTINRKVFADKLEEIISAASTDGAVTPAGTPGRGFDLAVLSIGNDLVAQIEAVVNFRRLKPAHHFGKSAYALRNLALGAEGQSNSKSILEEYTTVFLENAIIYTSDDV